MGSHLAKEPHRAQLVIFYLLYLEFNLNTFLMFFILLWIFYPSSAQRKWRYPHCHHAKSCRWKVQDININIIGTLRVSHLGEGYAKIWMRNPKALLHPAQAKSMQNSSHTAQLCQTAKCSSGRFSEAACINKSVPVAGVTPITQWSFHHNCMASCQWESDDYERDYALCSHRAFLNLLNKRVKVLKELLSETDERRGHTPSLRQMSTEATPPLM